MESNFSYNASDVKELQEKNDTCSFDQAYQKALHATEIIVRDEDGRKLRLQLLLVGAERDEMRRQLNWNDRRLDAMEKQELRTQQELKMALQNFEKANSIWRASRFENEALKADIRSFENLTSNSEAILTEKLSLARELASLRHEIQTLRSQATSHHALVSENLALEGQLRSLQLESESLKRSPQAAHAKQETLRLGDARRDSELGRLEAELGKERCQREKSEREAQKESSEWERKTTTLELRLDACRNKLRIMAEQLKTCQAELHDSHTLAPSEPGPLAAGLGRKALTKLCLKRNSAQQHDADSMVGTPGDMPAAKKAKKGMTLPGDKSAFSITPFLSRASSVAVESSPSHFGHSLGLGKKQKSYEHMGDQGEPDEALVKLKKGTLVVTKPTKLPAEPIQSELPGTLRRGNSNMKNTLSLRNSRISSLEKVSESEEIKPNEALLVNKTLHKSTEVQKRQRKAFAEKSREPILGDGLRKTPKGDPARNISTTRLEKRPLTSASTFGIVSPLKERRRLLPVDFKEATS